MDTIQPESSCICGNTQSYLDCCGAFAVIPDSFKGSETDRKWADFRHVLHELYQYVFPLKNLHQAYWEKLGQETYPHHLLMVDPEYARTVTANFFWDYSVQFSDARPILRAARDIEGRDVRIANDFREWSLSALSLGIVVEADAKRAHVRLLGSEKIHRVIHGGDLPEPGTCIAARLLPYRGETCVHPAMLVFPRELFSESNANAGFQGICRMLGLKSIAGLRPDVHCDEWRRHGALVLSLWREQVYDRVVGVPSRNAGMVAHPFHLPESTPISPKQLVSAGAFQVGKNVFEIRYRGVPLAQLNFRKSGVQGALVDEAFRPYVFSWLGDPEKAIPSPILDLERWIQRPLSELNGESPLQAASHDFGKRRLRDLVQDLSRQGTDVVLLRQRLGL